MLVRNIDIERHSRSSIRFEAFEFTQRQQANTPDMGGMEFQWKPLNDEMGDASVIDRGIRIWHAQRAATPSTKKYAPFKCTTTCDKGLRNVGSSKRGRETDGHTRSLRWETKRSRISLVVLVRPDEPGKGNCYHHGHLCFPSQWTHRS